MSYSMLAAILLATIALSSAGIGSTDERNVLVRFYSDFAQLYRPALSKSYVDQGKTLESYRFFFTEKEYSQITEESLTMLNTNVLERTITFHPTPNFEKVGTRYFYRRDPKQEAIEIELVNSIDRLFREVRNSNRYFYLTSFENIEYKSENVLVPYYDVLFICNTSSSYDTEKQAPVLSYFDKNLLYSPRYLLDLPLFGSTQRTQMHAFADIRNNGEQEIVVKGAELIAGDITLAPKPSELLRTNFYASPIMLSSSGSYQTETVQARPLGELASGTYVYQLTIPSAIIIPPRSIKSVEFLPLNVTIKSFAYYSSVFSPINSRGKLLNAFNLTSLNIFIPNGRLILREQGRFTGQIDLPNLSYKETHTMTFGFDADVSYRRHVRLLEGNETSEMVKYDVEYTFSSAKLTRDIQIYFTESFNTFKYFQVSEVTTGNDNQAYPDIDLYGTDLRGPIYLTTKNHIQSFRFKLVLFRSKPVNN